jgi:hypothetical protein
MHDRVLEPHRLAGGRLALLIVAAGIFVLLVVIAAVIAGAAFAPAPRDRAAVRTLDMLLRLAPGYRPRPPDARGPALGANHRRIAASAPRGHHAPPRPCPREPGGSGVDCRPRAPGPATAALMPACAPDP